MSNQTLAWMEFGFNILYFVVLFSTVGAMLVRLPRMPTLERPAATRLVIAFALLGAGDIGHVGMRILAQIAPHPFTAWIGWGSLATAVTVTIFYVLLLDAWRVYFAKQLGSFEWMLLVAAAVRLVLMIPAGNDWANPIPPFGWSLARNLPLAVLGLGVMGLYLRDGRRTGARTITSIGVLIAISYACYAPVILLVQRYPMIGLLMIPKTVAYLAMGILAYRGLFRSEAEHEEQDEWPGTPHLHLV